jgi:dipeptidyl aminopeptidase/acylaminoacyl peptidase
MDKIFSKDLIAIKYLSNIAVSPERQSVAFVCSRADYAQNSYSGEIWIYDIKRHEYRMVCDSAAAKEVIWLNKDSLLFQTEHSRVTDSKSCVYTVFYQLDTRNNVSKELFRIPTAVIGLKRIKSDLFVVNGIHYIKDYDESALSFGAGTDEDGNRFYTEIPYWADGKGVINGQRNRLYLFDLKERRLVPISDEFSQVDFYNLDLEENQIIYTASTYTDKKGTTTGLYCYDLTNGETKVILPEGLLKILYAGFIAHRLLIVGSDMKRFGINENPTFYILERGKLKKICEYDYSFASGLSTDVKLGQGISYLVYNDIFHFISTVENASSLRRLRLDGDIDSAFEWNGSIECFDICSDGIYFVGMKGNKLPELYRFRDRTVTQLTNMNEDFTKTKYIVPIEKMEFFNDGVRFGGSVMKPSNFRPDVKYPGILMIHGGPKSTYGDVYHHTMQCLANQGYFVFYTNPRGSDGRGNDFANIVGKQGVADYEDLMAFTEAVLAAYPQIDQNRLGVTGCSYGGFMTNWIIGKTDMFACAVTESGIANWMSKIMATDIGYHYNITQLGATPWTDPEKLWNHSPMKYADKIKTPTLFIQPDEDYRCWMAEALQMFTSLKYHGVESKLLLIHGESHDLDATGRPRQRVKRIDEIIRWFDHYLKN